MGEHGCVVSAESSGLSVRSTSQEDRCSQQYAMLLTIVDWTVSYIRASSTRYFFFKKQLSMLVSSVVCVRLCSLGKITGVLVAFVRSEIRRLEGGLDVVNP